MNFTKLKTATVLSYLIAALAVLASGVGLLFRSVYRDNSFVKGTWFANDLITLFVAIPLLILGLQLASAARYAAC